MPVLDGIDLVKWKNDKNGCGGVRAGLVEPLQTQRSKLEGLSESQIVKLLGRPDKQELYKRNQKFYNFFLQPGQACGQYIAKPLTLSIRFNATGLAKEIVIETE
jgi:outer membrane protein assembly factor BamE (lipoprotein component of BamABCDE complex)